MPTPLLFLLACFLFGAPALAGQADRPITPDTVPATSLLTSGTTLRFTVGASPRRVGRLDEIADDSLTLMIDGRPERLAMPAIDSLWRRHTNTKTLVLGFGGLFAVLGGVVGYALGEYSGDDELRGTAAGVVLGGAFGAGLGALLARGSPRWDRIKP